MEWNNEQKIVPKTLGKTDYYGRSVDIDGDHLVVCAPYHNNFIGAGFVYHLDSASRTWELHSVLSPPEGEKKDVVSWSASISGNYIALGAKGDDTHGINTGAVYLYQLIDDQWELIKKLTAGDSTNFGGLPDEFGSQVKLQGDTLVVGARGRDIIQKARSSGQLFVYQKDKDGLNNWGLRSTMITDDMNVQLGEDTIKIHQGLIYAGVKMYAPKGKRREGAIFIFDLDGNIVNSLHPHLGVKASTYGWVFDVSDEYLAVGNPRDAENGTSNGAVYVYQKIGEEWVYQRKIMEDLDPNPMLRRYQTSMYFGASVIIDGDKLILGSEHYHQPINIRTVLRARGSLYLYSITGEKIQEILASDAAHGDHYGCATALSGDTLVVGAYGHDGAGNMSGAAYTFTRS